MTRYLVRVYYEGNNYFGYQRQSDVSTIEETLLQALMETNHITSAKKNWFVSASRTDKNVNAIGNVIGFNSDKTIILEQINAQLPSDNSIVCWAHAIVHEDFSPKHSLKKKYWYLAEKSKINEKVEGTSLTKLQDICSCFEGKNDYKLFCKNDNRNTEREIEKIIVREEQNYILFEFVAQSFLWEQVRRIVAYVLNYENLSEELKNTKTLLRSESSINSLNIQPADPNNLMLVEHYFKDINWVISKRGLKTINDKINNILKEIRKEEVQRNLVLEYIDEIKNKSSL